MNDQLIASIGLWPVTCMGIFAFEFVTMCALTGGDWSKLPPPVPAIPLMIGAAVVGAAIIVALMYRAARGGAK